MTEAQLTQLLEAVEQRVDKAVEPFKELTEKVSAIEAKQEELAKALADQEDDQQTGNTGTEGDNGDTAGNGGTDNTEGATATTAKSADEDALRDALAKALDKIAELEERIEKRPARKSVVGQDSNGETKEMSDDDFLRSVIRRAASGEKVTLGTKGA